MTGEISCLHPRLLLRDDLCFHQHHFCASSAFQNLFGSFLGILMTEKDSRCSQKNKTHDSTATLETRLKMFTRILPRQSEQTEAVLACTAFGSCSTINIFILSTKRFLTATLTSSTSAQPSLMRLLYKGFSKILCLSTAFAGLPLQLWCLEEAADEESDGRR